MTPYEPYSPYPGQPRDPQDPRFGHSAPQGGATPPRPQPPVPGPGNYPADRPYPTHPYPQPQTQPQPQPPTPSGPYPIPGQSTGSGPQPPQNQQKPKKPIDWNNLIGRTLTTMLVAFLTMYFSWLYAPKVRNQMTWWPTNTPTPVTPSPTPIATATITPLATNTATPIPTNTPEPLSEYWIADGNEIDPPVPDSPAGVIELHVDTSAEVNPELDSGKWTSSKQIVADLGKALYQEEWFATYSPGWIRWFTDRPLREGLYQLYIMDTVFSSGGTLDYTIQLGDQVLPPLAGASTVHYMTSQYDPVQTVDTWRSLGLYYLPPNNSILTVTTSWEERDEYTIVSMDRLLIVPREVNNIGILNALPATERRYVRDDMAGETIGRDYVLKQRSDSAWDGTYQLVLNPKERVKFTLPGIEPWPIGNYKIYAYMPTTKGGITANFTLTVDRKAIPSDAGTESVAVTAPTNLPGQWVKVGSWTTDKYYERPRKIGLELVIDAESVGEFPIDAIAYYYTPFEE